MAAHGSSTTRRRVLGAAAALPVLAFAPSTARPEPVEAGPERGRRGQSFSPEHRQARTLWNRRLAHYHRLATEAEQAATTGWFRSANDLYYREIDAIEALPAAHPDQAENEKRLQCLRRAAFKRIAKAENAYWHRCTAPMERAAVALVLTPTPDLAALAAKLAIIRAHQLHEEDGMTRDVFEVLEEDVRVLQQLVGRRQSL